MIRLPAELVSQILADEDLTKADILSVLLATRALRAQAERTLYTHVILPPSHSTHQKCFNQVIDVPKFASQLHSLTMAVGNEPRYPGQSFGQALTVLENLKELKIHQPRGPAFPPSLSILDVLQTTSLPFSLRVLRIALNAGFYESHNTKHPIFIQRGVEHLECYFAEPLGEEIDEADLKGLRILRTCQDSWPTFVGNANQLTRLCLEQVQWDVDRFEWELPNMPQLKVLWTWYGLDVLGDIARKCPKLEVVHCIYDSLEQFSPLANAKHLRAVALLHYSNLTLNTLNEVLNNLFTLVATLERVELRQTGASIMFNNPRYPEGAYSGIVCHRGQKYVEGKERISWNSHWYLGF